MKTPILTFLGFTIVMTMLIPFELMAGQRRRVVVRPNRVVVRRPVRRTKLVVRTGHPIRRALPGTVVVRPARRVVTVGAPLVFLPAAVWTATEVSLPPSERLAWQDSETIERDEGWVDTNFGIDNSGKALYLDVNGVAQLSFAEIAFANGNVQVVDFNDQVHRAGIYKLLDFVDGRHVKTARILAKSDSDEAKLAVYLSK